jgi:aspartate/methionine/tyrosine aminotransferase
MLIPLHLLEPWLIKYQNTPYNLAGSGVTDQTLRELLEVTGVEMEELLRLDFTDNETRGSLPLRQAIAALYDIDPDIILVTHGTSEGLFLYFHVRYQRGANVVVPVPAFQNLHEVPRYLGYEVRLLQLRVEDNFRPNLEELAKLVDSNTKTIVLNNPHNPTGILYSDSEVKTIIEIAERNGAEILADEHYRFIPYTDIDLIPSLYGRSAKIVATGSMIKSFGCAGLRVGWFIGPPELIENCRNLKDYTTHTMCSINDYMARRLLEKWQKLAFRHRDWITKNVSQFGQFIARHNELLDWVPPQAGIVAFPFFKDQSINSTEFARALVSETGVCLMPGDAMNMPGHFRIGFGIEPVSFAAALDLWSSFVQKQINRSD